MSNWTLFNEKHIFLAPRMCEESSLQMNKEASSEKEILDSEKFKTKAVAAGLDKFHVPIETLLGKVKKNKNLI